MENEQTGKPTEAIRFSVGMVIKNLFAGFAIGGGAILPGISGGVLCVIFGIYRPMMELFAHPKRVFVKYWKMFLMIGIGWLIGFWGFAKVVDILFQSAEIYATWLFIGLIIGTLPALYRSAGEKGRTKASYISMAVSFVVLFSVLLFVQLGTLSQVTPNILWFGFCGVLWGLSLVIPGMTSSSILMSLGIYQDMNAGIASLDLKVIIPWLIGLGVTALSVARLVNFCFERKYSIAYHAVVGVVIASTVVIIPRSYEGTGQFLLCLLCGIVGAVISLVSSREPKKK